MASPSNQGRKASTTATKRKTSDVIEVQHENQKRAKTTMDVHDQHIVDALHEAILRFQKGTIQGSEASQVGKDNPHRIKETEYDISELRQHLDDQGKQLLDARRKLKQLREENNSLRADLFQMTRSSTLPSEEQIAAKHQALFDEIEDWVRVMFSEYAKDNGAWSLKEADKRGDARRRLWIKAFVSDRPAHLDRQQQKCTLMCIVSLILLKCYYAWGPFGFGRSGEGFAYVANKFKEHRGVAIYKRQLLMAHFLREENEPEYRQTLLGERTKYITEQLLKTIRALTSGTWQQGKAFDRDMKRIAGCAAEFFEMLHFQPNTYRLLPFRYDVTEYDQWEVYDAAMHIQYPRDDQPALNGDKIVVMAFPGLMKMFNERGRETPGGAESVVCRAKVMMTPRVEVVVERRASGDMLKEKEGEDVEEAETVVVKNE
ncbi:Hypothetical protein D9617_18g033580 [Elsinoe fawcettii]|nr:Hypothetical protein D9617_18g033580 [Elsinoe fawcettii]